MVSCQQELSGLILMTLHALVNVSILSILHVNIIDINLYKMYLSTKREGECSDFV